MKFKVKSGIHAEDGKIYRKGQIVDSKSDLNKLNTPLSRKFEQIDVASPELESVMVEAEPATSVLNYSREELEQLKTKELEEIAERQEVDLSEVSNSPRYRKTEIIDAILGD